ncbi:MAG: hypothetical protein EOM20_10565 [Spartobacteria bacterium]|nr:hypothetical protein [Spartobacteria bacterium]
MTQIATGKQGDREGIFSEKARCTGFSLPRTASRVCFEKNAGKRPFLVKNAENWQKTAHFCAVNHKNCHFWPFLTDFCRFLVLLLACADLACGSPCAAGWTTNGQADAWTRPRFTGL